MLASDRIPVVILNYNGWNDTFASVARMLGYVDEIWVVDNGSAQDRCAEVVALSPKVRTLRHPRNLGWAGGYNRALRALAREGWDAAYLLNNDAVLEPGALEQAARLLRADRSLAAVGSAILTDEGRKVWFDGSYHADKAVSELEPGVSAARTLNGAGFALNLAAFDALGPFHEAYFLYHEEADWFCRAWRAGWSLLVNRSSWVHHAREGSDQNFNARYYRLRNRFLASRRGVWLGDGPERWRGALRTVVRALATPDPHARRAAADALLDGVRGRFGPRPASRNRGERWASGALALAGLVGTRLSEGFAAA